MNNKRKGPRSKALRGPPVHTAILEPIEIKRGKQYAQTDLSARKS